MNYIVLDLEFNQSFPFNGEATAKSVPECPFEIIQIGAIKLDENFQQLDSFNHLIEPQIYTRIHPFVGKITGITSSDLKGKPHFPDVFEAFLNFIGNEPSILCTWGADDIKSLFRNILYYKLDISTITKKYINVQTYASAHLESEQGKAIGLKNAVTALGLEMEEDFHDALNDARYTAEVFVRVHPNAIEPNIFMPQTMLAPKKKTARVNMPALLQHMSSNFERTLTPEEKRLIRSAYKLGQNHTYDIAAKKKPITD